MCVCVAIVRVARVRVGVCCVGCVVCRVGVRVGVHGALGVAVVLASIDIYLSIDMCYFYLCFKTRQN